MTLFWAAMLIALVFSAYRMEKRRSKRDGYGLGDKKREGWDG